MQDMRLLLITLLSLLIIAVVPASAQNLQWFANDHFELTELPNEVLKVAYEKKPWEAFTLYLGEADFSQKSVLTLSVKSSVSSTLRIDLMDQEGVQTDGNTLELALEGGADYVKFTFDFHQLAEKIDLRKISHLHFYVDPGKKATGAITIKNLELPETGRIYREKELVAFPNPVTDILSIKAVGQLFDELTIFDAQGREVSRTHLVETDYHEIKLSHLPTGLYQYQLSYQTKIIAADRIVVE